ncbi:MAG TPA: nicotinic acid mononucleotide adenylyltransferase, partial [Acidimicrobiia bacterium]
MRRGILGGTFDPPHVAHLVAAETAYRQLALDVVTLMPAGDPWQKADRRVSDPVHRLAMTELAAAGVGYFEVDDREVRRRGPTYTIETIGSFPADDDIVLILGADAAAGLAGWHRADEVRGRASFAVMPRPGIAA